MAESNRFVIAVFGSSVRDVAAALADMLQLKPEQLQFDGEGCEFYDDQRLDLQNFPLNGYRVLLWMNSKNDDHEGPGIWEGPRVYEGDVLIDGTGFNRKVDTWVEELRRRGIAAKMLVDKTYHYSDDEFAELLKEARAYHAWNEGEKRRRREAHESRKAGD